LIPSSPPAVLLREIHNALRKVRKLLLGFLEMGQDQSLVRAKADTFRQYVRIARPDHWIKNIFIQGSRWP
jgi:hypothetical protein